MKLVEMKETRLRAILFGVQLPGVSDAETSHSLDELERLVTTLGFDVVGRMTQKRPSISGTVIGEGKLEELKKLTGGKKKEVKKEPGAVVVETPVEPEPEPEGEPFATVVVFDCELSPSQMRNLQDETNAEVLDRTAVIVEIFSRHAKTREAKLQIEIARLAYLAPRIRETGGGRSERQGGGVGGRGSGESEIELDRRKIRDRIAELKRELASIQKEQDVRRSRRVEQLCVALVGYTNAGKSSLMRALTGSQVLVEDKLFATLDTTVRALMPETQPRVLVSDTVGFIKKLPHDLVASFKSTLDEANNASLLLHVVDASDAGFRAQLQVTKSVLEEIKANEVPSFLVLNKCDRVEKEQQELLQVEYPDAIFLSAKNPDDIVMLHQKIVDFFEREMLDEVLFVPYSLQGVVGDIRASMRVLAEDFEDEGVKISVRARPENLARLKKNHQL